MLGLAVPTRKCGCRFAPEELWRKPRGDQEAEVSLSLAQTSQQPSSARRCNKDCSRQGQVSKAFRAEGETDREDIPNTRVSLRGQELQHPGLSENLLPLSSNRAAQHRELIPGTEMGTPALLRQPLPQSVFFSFFVMSPEPGSL